MCEVRFWILKDKFLCVSHRRSIFVVEPQIEFWGSIWDKNLCGNYDKSPGESTACETVISRELVNHLDPRCVKERGTFQRTVIRELEDIFGTAISNVVTVSDHVLKEILAELQISIDSTENLILIDSLIDSLILFHLKMTPTKNQIPQKSPHQKATNLPHPPIHSYHSIHTESLQQHISKTNKESLEHFRKALKLQDGSNTHSVVPRRESGGGGRDIQRCLQGMFQVEGLVENILCG